MSDPTDGRFYRTSPPGRGVPRAHPEMRAIRTAVEAVRRAEALREGGARDWHGPIERCGVPVLSWGGSQRVVFLLPGGDVLKVDLFSEAVSGESTYESQSELDSWEFASDEERDLLCPVLAGGDDWVVMARAREADEGDGERHPARLELLERVSPTDATDQNLGWYDGRLVLLDYGR